MSIAKYLVERKIELLWQNIQLSIGIELKTIPCWLINKSWLEEQLEFGIKRGSAIVIILNISKKVAKLCLKRLRFGRALKLVEFYCKARTSLVCLSYVGVSYDYLRKCKANAI